MTTLDTYDILVEMVPGVYEHRKTVKAVNAREAMLDAGYLPDIGLWWPQVLAVPAIPAELRVNGQVIIDLR